MKKRTFIILIVISIICILLFAGLLINNNNSSKEPELKEFTGSKFSVNLDDEQSEIEISLNENDEIIVNMKSITGEDKFLTLEELQELGYSPIVKTNLDNTYVNIYTPDENLTQEDIERTKNTFDLDLTGVTYKDANKLGNLVNGPITETNTHYFPLSYSPYGTVMIYDGLKYDETKLPQINLEKFAEEFANLVNEDPIWDGNKKGFNIVLNTVEGTHVSLKEDEGFYYISTPYLRYNYQHITEKVNGEIYNGFYANDLLQDAQAKTLLAALNFFGDKAMAERVFSMIDYYYFFSKDNDKPITKELVEKYDLTYIKDVPAALFNGESEYYRDLYVSYNGQEWILSYDIGQRTKTTASLSVKIPIKRY